MIEPIFDKKIINDLERSTIVMPVNNNQILFELYMKIISWYHYHNIDANDSIYKKWKKFSELLGFKPVKYIKYLYKNALWVFKWKTNYILIYYDKRGMKIQISPKFDETELIEMCLFLMKKIL